MDRWSFYQVIAYDKRGHEIYYDRPPTLGKFLLLNWHAVRRLSRKGHKTWFKAGGIKWSLRCTKLPWRPW